jgi:hypothetical protein
LWCIIRGDAAERNVRLAGNLTRDRNSAMNGRCSRTLFCMLLLMAIAAALGMPGALCAAGTTDLDEEATIGDPDEQAQIDDSGEQGTVGDPGEQATVGDPGEKARIGDPGEKAGIGDPAEKKSF